jgi:hypothetical protein
LVTPLIVRVFPFFEKHVVTAAHGAGHEFCTALEADQADPIFLELHGGYTWRKKKPFRKSF